MRILKRLNREHYETPSDEGDCLYESVLCGITSPTGPKMYHVEHLKHQIFMYMIENPAKCTEILKPRLQSSHTCLSNYILKFVSAEAWGEEYLLLILHAMWGLTTTVVDVTVKDVERDFGHSGGGGEADVVIIYNGINHYTATG